MSKPSCTMPGCTKPSRNPKSAALCPMHYHRQYRHGRDITAADTDVTASHGRRYVVIHAPGHPVAHKDGKAYAHRVVLYDHIGAGPHPCHWCQTLIDWLPRGDAACLQVDHLNHKGDDNRVDNLVASCAPCNTARGSARRRQALLDAGWWSEHDTIARLRDPARRRAA